ncbi:MAG: radical SAM protein [Candidatus Goldbacteria bacterium]|nr:radical SAM protein [Candidatus Goldiibacteriota bacterium]
MYIFGPVPSRRLGLSLGIDLLNFKSCDFNCIYCELGRTFRYVDKRQIFVKTSDVMTEFKEFLSTGTKTDYVTFSGSGEPTLALNLGEAIGEVKKITNTPVALITNSSLFYDDNVIKDTAKADVVLPSMDAADEETFIKINRPHGFFTFKKFLDGFMRFCKEYKGKIWVEVMLVKGINDDKNHIMKLKSIFDKIPEIEKIQLNTVVRLRAEEYAEPLESEKMEEIKKLIGERAEIIGTFKGGKIKTINNLKDAITSIVRLRPVSLDDLKSVLNCSERDIVEILEQLEKENVVKKENLYGRVFYKGMNA